MSNTWQHRSALFDTAELEARRDELVKALPVRAPIFLPTDRIPIADQVSGLERVAGIFASDLDQLYRPRLRALRDRYVRRGRCFVIGNGPSLNRTDLRLLKDEVTFATNGFFLKVPELDWNPTFYVVEDHLVAEDRADWINSFKGPTKLFPANLAYCLNEGKDTVFFNLLPRKSYPHGFDFSVDASEVVYAGGTVTFSCLQLAYYFGFREIYLVGVDADYSIPQDAKVVGETGVSELDMVSDDPNHFHPDYFGKGFRWHDPNVDRMIAAYEEAKRTTEAEGRTRIYNATIGGKLEVFPRAEYESLFVLGSPWARGYLPRVLLIDMTEFGGPAATGQLKSTYFASFDSTNLAHLFARPRTRSDGPRELGFALGGSSSEGVHFYPSTDSEIVEACDRFKPELIVYRPVPDRRDLHDAAMRVIRKQKRPWVVWMMDDWPERLRISDAEHYRSMDHDLRALLHGAVDHFAISEAMAEGFGERYGVPFKVYRNGAVPRDWSLECRPDTNGRVRVRYAGSLAPDTTRHAVFDFAEAVEAIAQRHSIAFEIRTQLPWFLRERDRYRKFRHVELKIADLDIAEYRQWLVDADILLVAYNFDPDTIRYLRFSFGNKVPEYLASGGAVLAYGPQELSTIRYLADRSVAVVVDKRDPGALRSALEQLVTDEELRARLAQAGKEVAFGELNLDTHRNQFLRDLRRAALMEPKGRLPPPFLATIAFGEEEKAQINECRLVYETMEDGSPDRTMVDVGAHEGSSLRPFAAAGWRVYAFEPDPSNREQLSRRVQGNERVILSDEAVTDVSGQQLPFYASDESTGISGLSAFRDTHREVGRVRTVTLDDVVARHKIETIDFLKIDIEGWELPALRALDFSRMAPRAVLAEYENDKTEPHGYDAHDLAQFLVERGYAVYVSEWYPIERYGVRHGFRRLQKYPCDIPASSWGNLIAFKDDPDPELLKQAVRAAADRPVAFEGEEPVRAATEVAEAGTSSAAQSPPAEGIASLLPLSSRFPGRAAEAPRAVSGAPAARLPSKIASLLPLSSRFLGRATEAPRAASGAAAARPSSESARARSRHSWLSRTSLADLLRPARQRPVLSITLSVAALAALVTAAAWPVLPAVARPQILFALIAVNVALTVLFARLERRVFISRMSDFFRRTEDFQNQADRATREALRRRMDELQHAMVKELQEQSKAVADLKRELAEAKEQLAAGRSASRSGTRSRRAKARKRSPRNGGASEKQT